MHNNRRNIMEALALRISKFAKKLARYSRYRNTVTELSLLSDRDLADIGIHRSQIHNVALQEAIIRVK